MKDIHSLLEEGFHEFLSFPRNFRQYLKKGIAKWISELDPRFRPLLTVFKTLQNTQCVKNCRGDTEISEFQHTLLKQPGKERRTDNCVYFFALFIYLFITLQYCIGFAIH